MKNIEALKFLTRKFGGKYQFASELCRDSKCLYVPQMEKRHPHLLGHRHVVKVK